MLSFKTRLAKTSFVFSSPTSGSLSINSTPTSGVAGNATNVTFAHTVSSGNNRMLLVMVASGEYPASSVTYNSVSLSLIGSSRFGGYARSELWYLLNPDVGTYNVSVNFTSNNYTECGAITFNGVNQSTPYSGLNSLSGTSINVSSGSNSIVVALLTYWNNVTAATVGDGQTSIFTQSSDGAWRGIGSYKSGSATTNMYYTTSSTDISLMGVSINP